jgi:geranylgeranyl reductase family protein
VIIAGAGPGGAACALSLAGSGLRVALLDKARFPRDKICGDALSGKVVSVLKYTSPAALEALRSLPPKLGSWGIRFVAPDGEVLDIPFKSEVDPSSTEAPGYISKRLDFDDFLVRQAAAVPEVDWIQDFEVEEVSVLPDKVRVRQGGRQLEAAVVVGADGAHSVVAKQLSEIRVEKNHYSAGLRAYYQGVTGFHVHNFVELHYIKSLLPGYFWVFPLPNGMANVGLGMLSRDVSAGKVNLRERLLEIVADHPQIAPRFSQAQLIGKIQGFGLPLGSKKRHISGNRFLLVGDAASLIDPFSGEGIGNAMVSGRVAAQQIRAGFEADDFSAESLLAYDREVYRKLWSELRLSHTMQKLVNYPWLFNFVVRKANRNASIRTMMTMMFENLDIRKELSRPSFYWKLVRGGR